MTDDTLWYFGYGSNMDPRTFLGRRSMQPLSSQPGQLEGFELCFDLAVGPGERGVANVCKRPGGQVWGVLYCLRTEESLRLDRTEGVHRGHYVRLPVEVKAEGGPRSAFTYHSARGRPGRKPSRRYLGLLLAGARHHRLPPEYLETLRAIPMAVDERDPQLSFW